MGGLRILISAAMLAGCSAAPPSEAMMAYDAAEPEAAPAAPATDQRIAYVYRLGFALDPSGIPALQERHEALCRRLASAGCRILRTSREAGADGAGGDGSMTMVIDARFARRFATVLEQAAAGAGARTSERAMESEDVTKATIDAEARLRQRELLVERLTDLLRTRQGSVGDLVAAERRSPTRRRNSTPPVPRSHCSPGALRRRRSRSGTPAARRADRARSDRRPRCSTNRATNCSARCARCSALRSSGFHGWSCCG